jgi:hypothetical protein
MSDSKITGAGGVVLAGAAGLLLGPVYALALGPVAVYRALAMQGQAPASSPNGAPIVVGRAMGRAAFMPPRATAEPTETK